MLVGNLAEAIKNVNAMIGAEVWVEHHARHSVQSPEADAGLVVYGGSLHGAVAENAQVAYPLGKEESAVGRELQRPWNRQS